MQGGAGLAKYLRNPYRGRGWDEPQIYPASDARPVAELLEHCPSHAISPLVDVPVLADAYKIESLFIKDERDRMGLGSFKALGAAFAIACDAKQQLQDGNWSKVLDGHSYVTASAGSHGLSVAAGARLFGARAVVFLAETVPEAFAVRLRDKGASVVRAGKTYEESMSAAADAAATQEWTLLSDSSWPGYTRMPLRVMEGYLQLAAEAATQFAAQVDAAPSHILLQAGVGGLAAAVAAHARVVWGDEPTIVVVEPEAAPALIESVRAGRLVTTEGPVSAMGRLDCKTPSMIALAGLVRDADLFVTISESEADLAVKTLADHGFETTPSGVVGLAALFAGLPGIGADSRVLAILSEGPEQ